jgi:sugar diacid utilization regulator
MRQKNLVKENLQLLEQEEIYWSNRCHEQWLLQGDNNTSYFHRIASCRQRKNIVLSLEKDGVIIEGDENLLNHATEYYSELFDSGDDRNIHIDQNMWEALEVVSVDDNEKLCRPFSESEIKDALL